MLRKPLKRKPMTTKRLSSGLKVYRRRIKPAKSKDGSWTLKQADTKFSNLIRGRDGKCMHPKCKCRSALLQCSHYFGRAIKSTRFDPDNCITLSWYCHYKNKRIGFEYQKQTIEEDGFDGQYTLFMKQWLGPERFNALKERSKQKMSPKQAIQQFQEHYKTL